MKAEPKELIFFPWSMSATGDWSEETGLGYLRDYAHGKLSVEETAEGLWTPGAYVQNSAVIELLKHGNVRQAAALVRTLIELHPVCENSLRETFGDLVSEFLVFNLERWPSKPEEYPSSVRISVIQ